MQFIAVAPFPDELVHVLRNPLETIRNLQDAVRTPVLRDRMLRTH